MGLVTADADTIAGLERKLLADSTSLPEKYRCMFSLRGVEGQAANKALLLGEHEEHLQAG